MLFDGWQGMMRILAVGPLAYLGLVLMLRLFGKRTLSKMNAFDLVVTVALGSTLATALLSKDVPLVDGLVALAVLILLQWLISKASVHSERIERWINPEPRLLLHRGEVLHEALQKERVTKEELAAATREAGLASLALVEAIVLETNGDLSVVPTSASTAKPSALKRVKGYDEPMNPSTA